MKHYFLATSDATKVQDNEFIEFLKELRTGYWHWISNFWIIPAKKDNFVIIRDKAHDIYKGRMIFIEANQKRWGGRGPNNEKQNMFKWIYDQFS